MFFPVNKVAKDDELARMFVLRFTFQKITFIQETNTEVTEMLIDHSTLLMKK